MDEGVWVDGMTRFLAEIVRAAVKEAIADTVAAVPSSPERADVEAQAAAAEYVTSKDAARLMSAHPSTIRKLIAAGKLRRYSVEGRLRVRVSEVHAYLAREPHAADGAVDVDERARELLAPHRTTAQRDSSPAHPPRERSC